MQKLPMPPLRLTRRHTLSALGAGVGVAFLAGWVDEPLAAPNAQKILADSDAVRNPGVPFRVTLTIAEFEKGQQVDVVVLASYARLDDTGQFASVLKFLQPAKDEGKLMLKYAEDLWFYDPATKASVRLPLQQRLVGQAANGDVISVNFAKDYKAVVETEENIVDGERKPHQAWRLRLSAAAGDAIYDAVELWVDTDNARPLKAKFYAQSGRLMKTAYYRRYQEQLGAMRPTETVIIDGLNPQQVTIVRMSDFAARRIPMSWMQREYLPRFQGD